MHKLSDLKISPAPWTVSPRDNTIVTTHDGHLVAVGWCERYDGGRKNIRLIAAAPELYEEQYHDCVSLRTIVTKLDEGAEILNLRDILAEMADRMEAGLAEAAGEEVKDGK